MYNVSIWVTDNNEFGGYWESTTVATMAEARDYVELLDDNWSIRPEGQHETTWMFAMVAGKRVGAAELWAEYDATADDSELDTDPEIAEFMRVAGLVTAWNRHRTAGTTNSPECDALDAQLEQCCDRWDMDANGYLYLL